MKSVYLLSSCVAGLLFLGGCAKQEFVFTQQSLCQAPIAQIVFQSAIKKGENGVITQDDFKKIATQVIKDTGCFELKSSLQDNGYVLNAVYETKNTRKTQKETFKSQTTNTFSAKVTLNLSNTHIIRREFGESVILIEENKVLGMGKSQTFSAEDEIKAIKNSTLVALKNFIQDLQKEQEQNVTPQDSSQEQEETLKQDF